MPASSHPARAGSMRVALWQRQRLGHADRQRIMEAARHLERHSHRPGLHGGCLRRTGIAVLWAILYRGQSRHGVHDPALSQLATWCGVARSTVQAAIARIEAAGIMGHVRRGVTVAARWCQWTSAYLFAAPERWASDTGSRSAIVTPGYKKASEQSNKTKRPALPASELLALTTKWGLDPTEQNAKFKEATTHIAKN